MLEMANNDGDSEEWLDMFNQLIMMQPLLDSG